MLHGDMRSMGEEGVELIRSCKESKDPKPREFRREK
jgi:hypothetical protein